MKRLILILSILFPLLLSAQDYYWYRGNKINLEIGNKEYVMYDSDTTAQPYRIIAKDENTRERIIYRTQSYKSPKDSTNDIFVTDRFNVKLRHANDYSILQQMATLYHVEVLSDTILPLWHTLQCTRLTQYNALELANIFYESGNFAAAKPEFLGIVQPACVNDTYFPNQWNLKNTGQNGIEYEGIDINYCQAHSITSGDKDIIIAVYDWGVELSHPNLNIYPLSYDIRNDSSPSQICYDSWRQSFHGTACAGIISDISDDDSGGAGISPSCPIMSISMPLTPIPDEIARGFHFAANNNCSVINCSWETELSDEEIDEAILYALQNGRDGLGCVVIFAAGNDDYPFVLSPADSHEEILVVGAINTSIQRRPKDYSLDEDWGSCYGEGLDVMAPGEAIPTTDLTGYAGSSTGDYYPWGLSGTSIAAPHVSAVAGLILSVNPTLTAKQVADIIETTAQKVGGYEYVPTEGRPNGKWHEEMGYGLVDAYAAVLAAQPKYIQNQIYQSGQEVYEYATEITAGYAVTDEKPYGDVVFEAGSDVTLRGMDRVVLKPGFHAKAGSKLHIKVDPPTTTQAASLPQQVAPRRSSAPTDDANSTNEEFDNNGLETVAINRIVSTSIYTISGQLLQTIAGDQHDATHLPNGMYILQHRMSDGSVKNEKIANNK